MNRLRAVVVILAALAVLFTLREHSNGAPSLPTILATTAMTAAPRQNPAAAVAAAAAWRLHPAASLGASSACLGAFELKRVKWTAGLALPWWCCRCA
jgi:hypothetical protein